MMSKMMRGKRRMKSLDAGILSNCAGRDKKPRATATAASGDMTNHYSGSPVRNTVGPVMSAIMWY